MRVPCTRVVARTTCFLYSHQQPVARFRYRGRLVVSCRDLGSSRGAFFRNSSLTPRIPPRNGPLRNYRNVLPKRTAPPSSPYLTPYPLNRTPHPPQKNRKMKWSRKLAVVEARCLPLTPGTIERGMWVRVKPCCETVKKLCRGDGDGDETRDYAVGWEQGMDDTVGRPFQVGVVSRAHRKSPVVGLSVNNGLVAIAGGRFPTYGWFFPLEALEHV